jgi:hypothetical protein
MDAARLKGAGWRPSPPDRIEVSRNKPTDRLLLPTPGSSAVRVLQPLSPRQSRARDTPPNTDVRSPPQCPRASLFSDPAKHMTRDHPAEHGRSASDPRATRTVPASEAFPLDAHHDDAEGPRSQTETASRPEAGSARLFDTECRF